MREVECPICSSPTVLAWNKRCCTRCGWNVLRVREDLQKARYFPVFWLALACLFLAAGILEKGVHRLTDELGLFALFAAFALWCWRGIRKARAILDRHEGKVDSGVLQAALLRQKHKWTWLLGLPAPRQIRLTTVGRRHLIRNICSIVGIDALLALNVAGYSWALHREHGDLAGKLVHPFLVWNLALGVLATLFYGCVLVSYHRRAHRLLAHGTVGMARVVKQEWSDSGSKLLAECVAPAGQTIRATFSDRSKQCFEDTVVPLFYNPLRIKDTFVILGNDDYEIVGPVSPHSSVLI